MEDEQENVSRPIELEYVTENNELIIALSNDGVEYLQNILTQLKESEVDSHWHIDDFSGWLSGDIKHLIILKSENERPAVEI